jgi:hypothetical protein
MAMEHQPVDWPVSSIFDEKIVDRRRFPWVRREPTLVPIKDVQNASGLI